MENHDSIRILAQRLREHAAIHDQHVLHDDEQATWAQDLRAAADIISPPNTQASVLTAEKIEQIRRSMQPWQRMHEFARAIECAVIEAYRRRHPIGDAPVARWPVRTDAEIVRQTEELARLLMLEVYSRKTPEDLPFRNAEDPRGKHCWQLACLAQEILTATDPENSVSAVDDQDAAPVAAQAQHPDDAAVDRFAVAMKTKLAQKRAEGRSGWEDKGQCSQDRLSLMLRGHVAKGDPVDVANFAMMLHQRGERISGRDTASPSAQEYEVLDAAHAAKGE